MTRASGSRTLARGLAVLTALVDTPNGASITELNDLTGLDRAVLYRLLDALESDGYACRDPQTRKFKLGLAALELGRAAADQLPIREHAAPALEQLSEDTQLPAALAVADGEHVVVVATSATSAVERRLGVQVGERYSPDDSAFALAVSAFTRPDGPEQVRRSGLASFPQGTPTQIAAPVFDHAREVAGSVGVLLEREPAGDRKQLGMQVLRAARDVSAQLGWRPRAG